MMMKMMHCKLLYKSCGRFAYLGKTFIDITRQIVVVVSDKIVNKIKAVTFLSGTFNPLVDGSNPSWPTNKIMSIPDTWVTDYTEEMVDALLLDKVGFLNYRLIHNSHQAGFSRLPS
jgi:hypothetical protein